MTALHALDNTLKSGYVFTSESVSNGHTDKVCDQISDAILDAYLRMDPNSRVACETMATANRVILAGEIHSAGKTDVERIVREVIRNVGYTYPDLGFDDNCAIENHMHPLGRDLRRLTGAGDQGMMFGYACSQTKSLMPRPIALAHRLLQDLAEARKSGAIPHILPDAKSQVSLRYIGRQPTELETVVVSVHHREISKMELDELRHGIDRLVIKPVIASLERDDPDPVETGNCRIIINPTGSWTQGGPAFDAGLTGRKMMVDTYGGWVPHGGGAFSGKDASKVDRSGAYMARHIAKSIVASGLASECLVQVSYVIDEQEPASLMVDTFGSGKAWDGEIRNLILRNFDLTATGIIDYLGLREPIYLPTASYGHFGREGFSWEKVKKLSL